jgi:hypothetical protein
VVVVVFPVVVAAAGVAMADVIRNDTSAVAVIIAVSTDTAVR